MFVKVQQAKTRMVDSQQLVQRICLGSVAEEWVSGYLTVLGL